MLLSSPEQTLHAPSAAAVPAACLDLSVIIVNYNVREFLEQTLRSVERAKAGLSVEVFVVDNNSVDGSVDMVRARFPDVRLIANEQNVGFGRANNQAIRQAQGRYLLILNPDTIVQEDTFTTLVRFMEAHREAGAVGCQILNPDGTFALESRRAFPTPSVAFYRIVGLSRLLPRSRRFGRYNLTYLPRDEVAEVDALSGSCMLVRRAALHLSQAEAAALRGRGLDPDAAVPAAPGAGPGAGAGFEAGHGAGLFDEAFFMYGEDLDWCFRIQQAGWRIFYTPETQIIHYKGESTKKGELRYVRLFYGAMLQFTQKHFQSRYSRLLAGLLHVGIVVRAALTVLASGLRRLSAPLVDAGLVFVVVTLAGLIRAAEAGNSLTGLFFLSLAPGYALSTVAGIAAVKGYRRGRQARLRPVFVGATLGLLLVSAASFFIKEIAFSRAVVLLSYPLAALVLSLRRLVQSAARRGPRRAVLVGPPAEALRLQGLLCGLPAPPFELAGYVTAEPAGPPTAPAAPPLLGTLRHLRDLVRLRRIDEVIFAADALSNRTIFDLMQQLRDLPVQFKMLAAGCQHLIGKASVEDLSFPAVVEVEAALGEMRPAATRRAFEVAVAGAGLLLHGPVRVLARLRPASPLLRTLDERTRLMPDVLAGRRALVGFAPDETNLPSPEWGLKQGVFAIVEPSTLPDAAERSRAYWFYVRNQSAALDWDIILRSLRTPRRSPHR